MPTTRPRAPHRRTTAAALKQQILAFLAEALPAGWTSQPLEPAGGAPVPDILVISPQGRCHFLFVRAPADRWWDGGPRAVPAEPFAVEAAGLARRLRAAGHRARAIWGAADLARALTAWGCQPPHPVRLDRRAVQAPAAPPRPPRPILHLRSWRRGANA